MSVDETSKKAWVLFETANNEIEKGLLKNAFFDLEAAYKMALSIDETELECKILLSAISREILEKEKGGSSRVTGENYFLGDDLSDLLKRARTAANLSGDSKTLKAICNVFEARKLIFEKNVGGIPNLLNSAIPELQKEPFYLAYLNRTYGEYFVAIKSDEKARGYFSAAADLHIKNRYLAQISLDYYLLAQCEARLENKSAALTAIENALKYDKLSENTSGIASDYLAMSKILLKGNPTDRERNEAEYCRERAEMILKSMGK